MKFLKYLIVGILFGSILVKSEVIYWYRIFEIFKFQSFHMYGIIGSAVGLGILSVYTTKKTKIKSIDGAEIKIPNKEIGIKRYLIGRLYFWLRMALAGACPGPMHILVGTGVFSMFIVIAAATLGTFVYGILKSKLPYYF